MYSASMVPEPDHFDRSKPFYPIVMGYMCQLMGLKKLLAHGNASPHHVNDLIEKITGCEKATNISEFGAADLSKLFDGISGISPV